MKVVRKGSGIEASDAAAQLDGAGLVGDAGGRVRIEPWVRKLDLKGALLPGLDAAAQKRREQKPGEWLNHLCVSQAFVPLERGTRLVVTANAHSSETAASTAALDDLPIDEEDDRRTIEARRANGAGGHDDVQLCVVGAALDPVAGGLYLHCRNTRHSVLNALATHAITAGPPHGPALTARLTEADNAQTGALAALVTTDGHAVLLRRSKDRNLSTIGGFADAAASPHRLDDLHERTLALELVEEFLGDPDEIDAARADFAQGMDMLTLLQKYAIHGGMQLRPGARWFMSAYQTPQSNYKIVEFIRVFFLPCALDEFHALWASRRAVHKLDHDEVATAVRLDRDFDGIREFAATNPNGKFLALPILAAAWMEVHGSESLDGPFLPGSATTNCLPIRSLSCNDLFAHGD
jgi:hypothetical protein